MNLFQNQNGGGGPSCSSSCCETWNSWTTKSSWEWRPLVGWAPLVCPVAPRAARQPLCPPPGSDRPERSKTCLGDDCPSQPSPVLTRPPGLALTDRKCLRSRSVCCPVGIKHTVGVLGTEDVSTACPMANCGFRGFTPQIFPRPGAQAQARTLHGRKHSVTEILEGQPRADDSDVVTVSSCFLSGTVCQFYTVWHAWRRDVMSQFT